jgi:predicted amidohydrolase YtcJ
MYPARDFIDQGIIAAFGSDAPVTFLDPLLGIHAAVNRESIGGNVVGEKQRISVMEAIRAYTWNGAYASFEEGNKGSIEVGKLADFVILNRSILEEPIGRIKDLEVVLTMIDGKVLYNAHNLESSRSHGEVPRLIGDS